MAIHKKIPHPKIPGETTHLVMPAFSYATNTATADALAQIIIDAWASEGDPNGLQAKLLARDPRTGFPTQPAIDEAKRVVNAAGFQLTRAVVISEAEHDNDYIMQSDDEIVFVLPNKKRAVQTPGSGLLDTAKLLMACTPNGI